MSDFKNSPFEQQLEVVATLGRDVIEASINELRKQDRLTLGLRSALKSGVDINDLSNASGLTIDEIRRRVDGELHVESDVAEIAGTL